MALIYLTRPPFRIGDLVVRTWDDWWDLVIGEPLKCPNCGQGVRLGGPAPEER